MFFFPTLVRESKTAKSQILIFSCVGGFSNFCSCVQNCLNHRLPYFLGVREGRRGSVVSETSGESLG